MDRVVVGIRALVTKAARLGMFGGRGVERKRRVRSLWVTDVLGSLVLGSEER